MKKTLLTLSVLLGAGLCASAYDFMAGDLAYKKLDDNTVAVTFPGADYKSGKDYAAEAYVVPETVTDNGVTYTVVRIDDSAFYTSPTKKITLPQTVTYIDQYAFGSSSLEELEWPGVTTVGNYAFSMCKALKTLDIPAGLTSLPARAFTSSNNPVEKIILHTDPAIAGLQGANQAFQSNIWPNLQEVVIASDLAELDYTALDYWSDHAETLTFAEGDSPLKMSSLYPVSWRFLTFNFLRPVNTVDMSEISTSTARTIHVGDIPPFKCFFPNAGYSKFTVYVPGKRLAEYRADMSWKSFTDLLVEPGTEIQDETFGFNYQLDEAAGTAKIIAAGQVVDPYEGDIEIPEALTVGGKRYTVTAVGPYAFRDCQVTSVKFPSTLKTLENGAFQSTKITEIDLTGIESLGMDAFGNCRSLRSLIIPGTIKVVPASAFNNGKSLRSVVVEEGVESIAGAFADCSALTDVSLPGTLVKLDGTFENCSSLKEIVLPESLREIGWFTFAGTGIEELRVNEGIETLGMQSLGMMNGDHNADYTLKKVILPSTLTSMHYMALNNRRGLTEIVSLNTVPPVLSHDFADYVYNATLTVPNGCADAYRQAAGWKNFTEIAEQSKVTDLDASKILYTVGEGANLYVFQLRFGDVRRLDNLTWGFRTDAATVSAPDILAAIAEADSRLSVSAEGEDTSVSFDLISDGVLDERDVTASGAWTAESNLLASDGLTPVIVYSYNGAEPAHDYDFFVPAPDAQGVWIPEAMTVKLSDAGVVLPALVQVPDGKLNSTSNWQASSSNTSYRLDRTKIVTPYTLIDGTYNAIPVFTGATGTTYVRYRPQKVGEYAYYESNWMALTIEAPEVPMTAIVPAQTEITAGLNKTVEIPYSYEPADATFTAVSYASDDTKVISNALLTSKTAGSATVTLAGKYDPEVKAAVTVNTQLLKPVTAVNFGPGTEEGVINVPVRQLHGLKPIVEPADADIPDVTITLTGNNGDDRNTMTCSMYKVNWWDIDNVRSQFFELSGHRPTGDNPATLHVVSADGAYEKDFTVNVIEADRSEHPDWDYTDGTIILNEEWFGHTNGGLNYITPDNEVIYQAYEKENPQMAFGATSQYGTIWADKLIVVSKQARDGGDPLPGGGRLVIADAKTLKRLGSLDNLTFGDKSGAGRGVAGATPDKIYVGSNNGIYIVNIADPANPEITGRIGSDGDNQDLYSGQIGDMVTAGSHVFAVMQAGGLIIVDVNDDSTSNITDANIQGVTQSADGNVWYTTLSDGHTVFVALDPVTLEEIHRVNMPASVGNVVCGWGAWRSTAFHGSAKTNSLWFVTGAAGIMGGASGDYYRYDIDYDESDPAVEAFFSLTDVKGINGFGEEVAQMTYGTPRYDDRNDRLVVMTGRKGAASGGYRDHWIHFVDGSTGRITWTKHLDPYYWFQSLPIFPDKYAPEMEDVDELALLTDEAPRVIELNVTDRDNVESNILVSLIAPADAEGEDALVSQEGAEPAFEAALEGRTLTVTPKAIGDGTIGIRVQSNGRVIERYIPVHVGIDAIDGIAAFAASVASAGRDILVTGHQGVSFTLVNSLGAVVDRFTADAPRYIRNTSLAAGVYVISGSDGTAKKLILK